MELAQNQQNQLIAKTDLNELKIHGPRVIGSTPGNPFLFLIPATGKGQISYKISNLPDGLHFDRKSGIISGSLKNEGLWNVQIFVSDSQGKTSRMIKIIGGMHKLAQTPPMGWNSWNVWGKEISDQKVRDAAHWMEKSSLSKFGYQYINIDDGWAGKRDFHGNVIPHDKFPDMNALADFIHSKGLKFGIYSSPGRKTCARCEGSFSFEQNDALTYTRWGVDYLKYDWCSYAAEAKKKRFAFPHFFKDDHFYTHPVYPVEELKRPYKKMRECLDKCSRDIVYSLTPITLKKKYSPSSWGPEVGADLWRTSGDIKDNWKSMSNLGFKQHHYYQTQGPGYWNDPDMLVVGNLRCDKELHLTNLTQIEQITHFTLWTILGAPLLLSCDLSNLDEFTFNLVTNTEVIDIDQDYLCKIGRRIYKKRSIEVWKKDLWDGNCAIAIFNRSNKIRIIKMEDIELKFPPKVKIRDVWLKKGLFIDLQNLRPEIPSHGAKLYKIFTKPNSL